MRAAKHVLVLLGSSLAILLTACTSPRPIPATPVVRDKAPERPIFTEIGAASWYGKLHQGKLTADGERFDLHQMTAAHRSLPFGTIVRVRNEATGRTIKVRINDRGPYEKNRIIDLSAAAGAKLGIHDDGLATVQLQVFPSDQALETKAPQEVRSAAETGK